MQILTTAKVGYTDEKAGQIAAAADLEKIAYRCPGFNRFREDIQDC